MEKWDHPMERVIVPLEDTADEPASKRAALTFVIWSAFMMALGFFISLAIEGHIIIR
jgi:hypothetical protein